MRQRGRAFRDDDGQLMMLAGIVLTIAFILTALTLAQVSALEREAAADGPTPMVAEWRFLHERLASNVATAVGPETSISDFKTTTLPVVAATFRAVESQKGYDLILRRAAGATFDPIESDLLNADGDYEATTYDGTATYTHTPLVGDDLDDGIIMQDPCPVAGAPSGGCITGVYLYMRLSDGSTTLEETVLFATNQP